MGFLDLLRKRNAERQTAGRPSEATPQSPPNLVGRGLKSRTIYKAYIWVSFLEIFVWLMAVVGPHMTDSTI